MKCFNCEEPGHLARNCPWKDADRHTEPPTPTPPPFDITRRPADPPSASYLQAVAELGIPRNPDAIALLDVACPWCGSSPWQHCQNRALGTPKAQPHEARYQAAGISPPRRPALADVALRQVKEARAEKDKVKLT